MAHFHKSIQEIRDSIEEIEKIAVFGKEIFEQSPDHRRVVMLALKRIASHVTSFGPKDYYRHPDIDWNAINHLVTWSCFNTFEMDLENIWISIENEIPALKKAMSDLFSAAETKTNEWL